MQKAIDDFRRYWRLIFFLPVIAAAVCLVDFGGRPTTGDFWFASLALLYFAASMFRVAISAAPLLQAMAPTLEQSRAPIAPAPGPMATPAPWEW